MMKEAYERTELIVTLFREEDILTESVAAPLSFTRGEYEGHILILDSDR